MWSDGVGPSMESRQPPHCFRSDYHMSWWLGPERSPHNHHDFMITCDNIRRWRSKLFLQKNVSPGSNPLIGKKHCWYDEGAKDNDDYEEEKKLRTPICGTWGPTKKEKIYINTSQYIRSTSYIKISMMISQLGRKRSIRRTSCAPVTSTVVATVVRWR